MEGSARRLAKAVQGPSQCSSSRLVKAVQIAKARQCKAPRQFSARRLGKAV
jgi:hypothetical protein